MLLSDWVLPFVDVIHLARPSVSRPINSVPHLVSKYPPLGSQLVGMCRAISLYAYLLMRIIPDISMTALLPSLRILTWWWWLNCQIEIWVFSHLNQFPSNRPSILNSANLPFYPLLSWPVVALVMDGQPRWVHPVDGVVSHVAVEVDASRVPDGISRQEGGGLRVVVPVGEQEKPRLPVRVVARFRPVAERVGGVS